MSDGRCVLWDVLKSARGQAKLKKEQDKAFKVKKSIFNKAELRRVRIEGGRLKTLKQLCQ